MASFQPQILAPVPALARFLTFGLVPGGDPREALTRLSTAEHSDGLVLGVGAPIVGALRASVFGLRPFPAVSGAGVSFPSTQGALWALLAGSDAGVILDRARVLSVMLGDVFRLDEDVLAFRYREGRDLSGYEDGTENPKGAAAEATAIATGAGPGMDGSSFVAVQRWVHDLPRFERLSIDERDALMGRRIETNEEIADAPAYAHVKRAAQESYDPPAFMVRRSMPWGGVGEHGLYFVAFGASVDPFERVLRRMAGLDDGVVDGLLRFSRPVTGGYFFCPPVRDEKLDLSALGL